MQDTKSFSLATVLSVTTGRLLCDMEDIYTILNHMTGEDLMTNQLLRAADPCKSALLEQFAFLQSSHMGKAERDLGELLARIGKGAPNLRRQAINDWLANAVSGSFGVTLPATFDVRPLDAYAKMDPIEELAGMLRPDAKVVIITTEEISSAT